MGQRRGRRGTATSVSRRGATRGRTSGAARLVATRCVRLVARFPDVHEVTNIGTIRYLNCFTCNARVPSSWRTEMLSLLVETRQGLVLVDTGPGLEDYDRKPGIIRIFPLVTKVPLDPGETAVRHITRLGYRPEDVRHIVLTHMHFDHCGGLPDFP